MDAAEVHPDRPLRLRDLAPLPADRFRRTVLDGVATGGRVLALFVLPGDGGPALCAVLGRDRDGRMAVAVTEPLGESYQALTPECPQVHLFEREIAERWGLIPEGHPWLKPVRRPPTAGNGSIAAGASPLPPGTMSFFKVEGEEVHEVGVGPVHAGIIEPGHFRFQCHGERVLFLEIALGYQHRGVERALAGGPGARTIHYIETLAGDTSVGHALAYVQAVEALAGVEAPARGSAWRGIALELERVANHVGDLGALAGDIGYLPVAAFCGRLRGDVLNLTARLCGSRLGRGLVRPGGVAWDFGDQDAGLLRADARRTLDQVSEAAGLLWGAATVRARFEETGTVDRETCEALGLVGPAARACGIERDVRGSFPTGTWRNHPIAIATAATGDVNARAWVRWLEIHRSVEWLCARLDSLPAGPVRAVLPHPAPGSLAVSLVEGWRGEICHVAVTDDAGSFKVYKVFDPSFHNWSGLAAAMRGQQISDFPLCNKSFNLSYCGHDL
jgi:Ni,Fe-hydrogenase III large subunit